MNRIKARAPTARGAVLTMLWGAVAVGYKWGCPSAQQDGFGARVVTSAVFFAVGAGLILHVRRALLRELRQARRVARAAQSVVLRPPPPRLDGLVLAAAQLSAERGACVGGDLYEAIATEHGVRVVMGDVRGHGLAALGTVAAVLGSFREAAHDEPELEGVLRRLERALGRHLRERARAEHPAHGGPDPDHPVAEEFVTLVLLEIDGEGGLRALNCGHPWPYRIDGVRVEPLSGLDPLPPLGPFPLPKDLEAHPCGHLLPGDCLVLFTDGVEDARDAKGRFFSLPTALREAVRDQPVSPQTVLRTLFAALLHHTSNGPRDDIAVLVLRNDRTRGKLSCPGARGTARQAPTDPHATTRR